MRGVHTKYSQGKEPPLPSGKGENALIWKHYESWGTWPQRPCSPNESGIF